MKADLAVGLIGAGRIGRVHAGNLAHRISGVRLHAVADVDASAASSCAQRYGAAAHDDYRRVLDDDRVGAVVICSSTDTHAAVIRDAAQAGKHIFCEKPISLDLAEIDASLEAVRQAGVQLQIGYNRRFDATYRRVHDAVRRGEIGEPHLLHLISRDPSPPPMDYVRRSGGMFLDMTIHDFDMARYLVGSEAVEIYASAAVRIDAAFGKAGDVDTAVLMLRFADGTIGTIDNSRQAVYGYDQRAEVFGSLGSIRTENRHPNRTVTSTASGLRQDPPLHFFMERYAESYLEEMAAFVDAVLAGKPVPVDGEDGRRSVVMGLAARRSLDEKRPVRIAEVEG